MESFRTPRSAAIKTQSEPYNHAFLLNPGGGKHAVVSVGGFMNHPQGWEGPFW